MLETAVHEFTAALAAKASLRTSYPAGFRRSDWHAYKGRPAPPSKPPSSPPKQAPAQPPGAPKPEEPKPSDPAKEGQ
jgi:hypothetical protein